MAPLIRTKRKPKGGGIAVTTKPNNPATVNPAAANNTAVATGDTAKLRHLEHSTPTNPTAKHTIEPSLPAAVAVHPTTTHDANVLSGGDMVPTIGGSVGAKYGSLAILSLPSPLPPVAAEAPSMSLNLLDGKTSASNTKVDGEITRVVEHSANTMGNVETFMGTATNADGIIANHLPPDSVIPQKLNDISTNEKCPPDTNTLPVSTK
jgi:hypothetical protein